MKHSLLIVFMLLCNIQCTSTSKVLVQDSELGLFNINDDLLLLHYDCKTDVDDLHSIAALGSLLSIPEYSKINFHAVAGTYGIQTGKYVPANELFEKVFETNWSDAHLNREKALTEVLLKVIKVLKKEEGDVWIAEAGQSNFSSQLIQKIIKTRPNLDIKNRIHIVQHSNWNEEMTSEEDLEFVKTKVDYMKIDDGNSGGNGTPNYNTKRRLDWEEIVIDTELNKLWHLSTQLANEFNGKEGRYNNETITNGGLDFSDFSEVQWILKLEGVDNCVDYLNYIQRHK